MKQSTVQDLYTAAGEALRDTPDTVPWQDYPRPQLMRDSYLNLNGWWDFAVTDSDDLPTDIFRCGGSVCNGVGQRH